MHRFRFVCVRSLGQETLIETKSYTPGGTQTHDPGFRPMFYQLDNPIRPPNKINIPFSGFFRNIFEVSGSRKYDFCLVLDSLVAQLAAFVFHGPNGVNLIVAGSMISGY